MYKTESMKSFVKSFMNKSVRRLHAGGHPWPRVHLLGIARRRSSRAKGTSPYQRGREHYCDVLNGVEGSGNSISEPVVLSEAAAKKGSSRSMLPNLGSAMPKCCSMALILISRPAK